MTKETAKADPTTVIGSVSAPVEDSLGTQKIIIVII